METRFTYLLKYIVALSDVVLISVLFLVSSGLAETYFGVDIKNQYRYYLPIISSLWLIAAFIFGMYSTIGLGKLEQLYRNTWRTALMHFLLFGITLTVIEFQGVSYQFFLLFYPLLYILPVYV